jgi:hypothetical protein
VKCRKHLHPLCPASAGYQLEFGGDAVQAGSIEGRRW